jgi:glutamate synthase (NADPH/NADH) small chain
VFPYRSLSGVEFEYTHLDGQGQLAGTGERFTLAADMVFKAIGQTFVPAVLDGGADVLETRNGRLAVDADRRTSLPDVWAGGDCVAGGQDLTVAGVPDGKLAALSIDRALRA